MIKTTLPTLLGLTTAAAAEPLDVPRTGLFADEPGLTLDAGAAIGVNDDDMATDFGGTHSMVSLQLGYRLHTGTQPFVTAALGFGGHEATFASYGGGVRQRIQLGRFAPYVDAGLYEVGDETGLAPAFGVGAGLEVRLDRRFYAGASATRYFSDDSDEMGGLDWGGRLFVGTRLGAGYR